jgi:DNA replication and repair protein RecF
LRIESIEVSDLRNIRQANMDLAPGLNVFVGRNAQGKTTILEAVALLARGRSFRTDETDTLVRRGASRLRAKAVATSTGQRGTELEVEIGSGERLLRVDGKEVPPRSYLGHLEAVIYSTDRLRVIHGPMRERRLYIDRAGSALWPSYRKAASDYERVLRQRNAALERDGADLAVWTERLVEAAAELRTRRARYVDRLQASLGRGLSLANERYDVCLQPTPLATQGEERERLAATFHQTHKEERRLGRTLSGPHRDQVRLQLDGEDAAEAASSGQARSLLLALALASLDVYREERGTAAIALLDDLDSELDPERATAVCHQVVAKAQALVTTAHPGWAERLGDLGGVFRVEAGKVQAA